ncbi:cupin domain-containing protein [Legionella longbeachae]|uniref:cupin domain-containing protein n=1 Tax=Legionella longbeachae TaxID=450 RepID=UPI0009B79175|nr:cupin domain-containing protein [Legionella longbeachae]ARB91018.1 cupin domain-containing protein [Legionella longbeachae]RZV21190.1 cupin domain-containing protein [Legionella longbeachae]UAK45781.1 cupin domain-containing protein [Legionella longbeachae]VEE02720.1 Cupin domain [Legionella oakridgensis]
MNNSAVNLISKPLAEIFNRDQIPSIRSIEENGKPTYLGIVKNFRSIEQLDQFIPQNGRLAASWVRLAKDEILEVHTHPVSSLYIITEGEAYLLNGISQQLLKKGDIITIPPDADHGFIGAGLNGYWGLSIQFEERGIYEDPKQPLVNFKDPFNYLKELQLINSKYMERFEQNEIFNALGEEQLSESQKNKFLDYLQILSDNFQKMVLIRSGLTDNKEFECLFKEHLKEEFGHDEALRNSRDNLVKREDAIFESLCTWFNYKMLTLDNLEKMVLVHLVIESSADLFYNKIGHIFNTNKITHFECHSEHDHSHKDVDQDLFKHINKNTFDALKIIQKQGWDIVEKQYERLAELILDKVM